MIRPLTEEEVSKYIGEVESGAVGEFSYAGHSDVLQELIARRHKRAQGFDQELMPRVWPTLCQYFGGLRSEDLMVVTGDSGKGKTTFVLRYLLSLLQQGYPGLLFSLEEGFSNLSKRLGEMVLECPEKTWDETTVGLYQTLTETCAPIYIFQPNGPIRQTLLLHAIKYAVLKEKVRFIVIDHLGFVQLNLEHGTTEAFAIGAFLRQIVAISGAYRVPVILVSHPAKMGDKGFKNREIGMDELKGSSDIKQTAHTVVSLFPLKDQTAVRFQKIRCSDYSMNTGLGITFKYDHQRSKLEESCTKPQKLSKGEGDD